MNSSHKRHPLLVRLTFIFQTIFFIHHFSSKPWFTLSFLTTLLTSLCLLSLFLFARVLNSVSPMSFISRLLQVTNARACKGGKGCPHKELGGEGRRQVTVYVPAKGCFTLAQRSTNRSRTTVWSLPDHVENALGRLGDSNLCKLYLDVFGNFYQNYRCTYPLTQQFHFQKFIYMHIHLLTLTCRQRNEHLRLFTAMLFPVPASYKQSVCPFSGTWLKES